MDVPLDQTPANRAKLARFRELVGELLNEGLRRGFYGSLRIELIIQDGTIQTLGTTVDRKEP